MKKTGYIILGLAAIGALAYYLKQQEKETTPVELPVTQPQRQTEFKALASALVIPVGKAVVDTLISYYRKKS